MTTELDEPLQGLAPIAPRSARLLVLGSFPGGASLAAGQYYAHPRNHFWPILGALWGVALPALPYRARVAELRKRAVAVWDVHAACVRQGSLDSAIRDVEANDLAALVATLPALQAVAFNGATSAKIGRAQLPKAPPFALVDLPSSSAANASQSFALKLARWLELRAFL